MKLDARQLGSKTLSVAKDVKVGSGKKAARGAGVRSSMYGTTRGTGVGVDIGLTDDQRAVIRLLLGGQLEVQCYFYTDIKKLCLLIRASIRRLFSYASRIDYSMVYDEDVCEVLMLRGDKNFAPLRIDHGQGKLYKWYRPYSSIHGPFQSGSGVDPNLYWRPKSWREARRGPVRLTRSKRPEDVLALYAGQSPEQMQAMLFREAQAIQKADWEKNKDKYAFDFEPYAQASHPFRESVRMMLTKWIILGKRSNGSLGIPVDSMVRTGQMDAFFPATHQRARDYLKASWCGPPLRTFRDHHLYELKEYVGYKVD